MINLPNVLTLSRIFVIVPIIGLFWVDGGWPRWATLGLYAAACVTDFFDGYLARARGEISRFGRFLDPVADKLLIASVILMLCAFERITGFEILAAVVILCREILVSGLREFLATLRTGLPVSSLAKWKTTIQMFALGFLIVGSEAPGWIPATTIGGIGLWVAAVLTMITGYDYLAIGIRHMSEDSENAKDGEACSAGGVGSPRSAE
ncbi:MAG: CDP-diacylglycerol--glycerol-3-phosphate 3-phosphatidyltransferase [Alphaproteobacteria bacterium MarineAlpha4_Bin2]|nr:MAG: CDP-diacylglycerol--glycerol-3-phosphate 3-phosphatidyltransferase [Alphaproteobacteria bacterium MarineAlpha4_Bin2]